MIPVVVKHVFMSNMGFCVLLRGPGDPRTLPIFVGAPEAQAISLVLEKIAVPRPMTHDLFKQVLDNLECRMKRVEICDLRDNTFYASLILEVNGLESRVDSRPSDAIALALRCAAPLYVAKAVMETAGVELKEETGEPAPAPKPLSVTEALKQQIAKAVEEERYEDAARLQKELKRQSPAN